MKFKRESISHKHERAAWARECKKKPEGNAYYVSFEYFDKHAVFEKERTGSCTVYAPDEDTACDMVLKHLNYVNYDQMEITSIELISPKKKERK